MEELSLTSDSDETPKGVVVADVAANSFAANFGVQKGDLVVEVNGTGIATTKDLESACAARARYWDLTISRNGQVIRSRSVD